MNRIIEKNNKEQVTVFAIEGDGLMIYNHNTENTHLLNETAAYLYELIDTPTTIEEIITSFKHKYIFDEISIDDLENDILELLDELSEMELIIFRRV